jgi:hypothetical protein
MSKRNLKKIILEKILEIDLAYNLSPAEITKNDINKIITQLQKQPYFNKSLTYRISQSFKGDNHEQNKS